MKTFDLEAAIAAWRQFACAEQAISEDDADELESHLRDQFDELVAEGVDPEIAFSRATSKLGSLSLLSDAYRQVYWKKARAERKFFSSLKARLAIALNFLSVSIRQMRRRPVFTAINVVGLAFGLAGCIFISAYVLNELTYDGFHENASQIYRLIQVDEAGSTARTGGRHASVVAENLSGVEEVARFVPWNRTITVVDPVTDNRTAYAEPDFAYADPSFLEVFSFTLSRGDQRAALDGPATVVITEATAQKYFGDTDPIGRVILMYDGYSDPNQIPLTVTGILAEVPGQSHLNLSLIASVATLEGQYGPLQSLTWPGVYTYALFSESSDVVQAEANLASTLGELGQESAMDVQLQRLSEIYLHPAARGEKGPRGSLSSIYIVVTIALIVLLLACINFASLSTARATSRLRELSIRRTMGANPSQLLIQFLLDAFLLAGVAVLAAGILVWLGKSIPARILGEPFVVSGSPAVIVVMAVLMLITAAIAGIYPAFLAVRQRPALALRGLAGFSNPRVQKILVAVQFSICMLLMVGTAIIYRQMNFVQSMDLGFSQERILAVPANKARRNFEPLRDALMAQAGVLGVSGVNGLPGLQQAAPGMVVEPAQQRTASVPVETQGVGPDFFDLLGIQLIAGNLPAFGGDVSIEASEIPANQRKLVINQTAAANLGWTPGEAIGQQLNVIEPGNEANNPGIQGEIVGVVTDFHHSSVYQTIAAHVYYSAKSIDVPDLYVISHMLLRLAPGMEEGQLKHIENTWRQFLPDAPFEPAFLDGLINSQYTAELKLGRIVGGFSGLAMVIALFGLFGLASIVLKRRSREVCIRKIMGASDSQVFALLVKYFLKIIGFAFIVAMPLAYWVMTQWLMNFAYRIDLGTGVFLQVGGFVMLIALLAIGRQLLLSIKINPVDTLRAE